MCSIQIQLHIQRGRQLISERRKILLICDKLSVFISYILNILSLAIWLYASVVYIKMIYFGVEVAVEVFATAWVVAKESKL